MNQKEIWLADLNPVRGSEQMGLRPVVIISGNVLNRYMDVVIACPFTTKIKDLKGNQVISPDAVNGLETPSELVTFQIRSISKQRLTRKLGQITDEQLALVRKNLDEILRY